MLKYNYGLVSKFIKIILLYLTLTNNKRSKAQLLNLLATLGVLIFQRRTTS